MPSRGTSYTLEGSAFCHAKSCNAALHSGQYLNPEFAELQSGITDMMWLAKSCNGCSYAMTLMLWMVTRGYPSCGIPGIELFAVHKLCFAMQLN